MTSVEQNNPFLLHAKVGAFYAMHKYKINDKAIIRAILYHTTGRPEMTLLEKIIYVADFIEPLRDEAENLDEVRKLAFEDIDKAMLKILSDTWDFLQKTNGEIDNITRKTYDYYKRLIADEFAEDEKENKKEKEEER